MDPQLSQRAGRAMSSYTFLYLDPDVRSQFVSAVAAAPNFEGLDARWQTLIVQAEKHDQRPPLTASDFAEIAEDEEDS